VYARGYPSSTHQSSSPSVRDADYELERVIDLPGGQNIVLPGGQNIVMARS
jgi:hypothetical protein